MIEPYPDNVDGDFFVENGCCTLCDVPMVEAPDLFAYAFGADGKPDHCYVSRQPTTDVELDKMVAAIRCAELQCIRYRGSDPILLERLSGLGESDICDAISNPDDSKSSKPWWRFW